MTEDFLQAKTEQTSAKSEKHIFRLYRRLFLLVCAIAVLWQGLLLVEMRLSQYYGELENSFKVILTVDGKKDNAALAQLGETLNQKQDISSVKLFSPQDGLEEVRRQNPQLAESLLLMGRNKMPAYFELKLAPKTMGNIRPFVDNLAAEYDELTPHYNAQHAQFIFYTGISLRLLRLAMAVAVLLFLVFMFLIEAHPVKEIRSHLFNGVVSGVLAWVAAGILFVLLIYPTGFLQDILHQFTTIERQLLGVVFSGLLGWTLTKWQKF